MPRFSLSRLRRPALLILGVVAMVLMLAWLMGAFGDRTPPGPSRHEVRRAGPGPRYTVADVEVPRFETAVGTVRAVRETSVAARVLGRVQRLTIERAGQAVQQGEVLVELEASDLLALADQARAALLVAETRRDKARLDRDRSEALVQQGAAAPERLDTDRATFRAAEAEVERARQSVTGAESALAFATVRAPISGIVVDKLVNQGDILQPGQAICTLYDPTRLQLVAVVREELAGRLEVGQRVSVTLDALGKDCEGQVAEIVPAAQAQSRAFEVKVTGPCQEGVVTGMFGRLRVPLGTRRERRVPAAAVQQVGQLDFVYVVGADDALERRFVRTGRRGDDHVEVLAGLAAGEVVLAEPELR
ncbi:MAG: efflux RND transporter periplasmic adaptor subunit [Planctomycetes bacterium]|nr:efflux RND transporter periplasmic adaptor subunit [Planctomycetota bacterium]